MAKKIPVKPKFGAATEEEVLLAAKNWFTENGTGLVFGVILVVAGIGGWKFWQGYQESHFNQAAEAYIEYLADMQINDSNVELLSTEYKNTPYPSLARLQRAYMFVENNELDKASEDLGWVAEHSVETEIATLAKMRQLRVLLVQKKYQEVLDELSIFDYGPAADLLAEKIRGDVYIEVGRKQEAIEIYKKVLEGMSPSVQKELLALKLDRISG